jgi:hypothetical protein
MPYPVKWFHSSFEGAPTLSSAAGTLIGVLDACLLTGFNTKTVDSITRSGTTATATVSGGHGYQKYQIVAVAGANEADYNGEFRVTGITSTTFTFEVANSPATPATGTLTAKTAPVGGWEKAFSGTNKAAYRSIEVGATGLYLRVDDTNTVSGWNSSGEHSWITAYETMTDVDTGSGWGSAGWWWKSYTGLWQWALAGDGRLFYVIPWPLYGGQQRHYNGSTFWFGDIKSYRLGDAYHAGLQVGPNNSTYCHSNFCQLSSTTNKSLARSYHQGPGISYHQCLGHGASAYLGYGGIGYPNAANNGLYIHDQVLVQDLYGIRGELPGVKQLLHSNPLAHNVIQDSIPARPGALLWPLSTGPFLQSGAIAQVLFDLVGPWR